MNPKHTTKTRLLVLLVAAVALLGIAPGAASAKKVHSDVGLWMQYQPPGTGVAKGFLFGGVSADKKACLNTTVLFAREKNYDPNTWEYGWSFRTVTKLDPTFAVDLENADRGHQYTIYTDKQVIRKGNKKIVCDYGTMPDVVNAN
jgi:hypothetical protein